jgi:hypothetical protein
MEYAYNMVGPSDSRLLEFKLGAAVAAGIVVCPDQTNDIGEIIACTTTAAANAVGLTLSSGTYSATQGDDEGTAMVIMNPFAVIKAKACGGATENTALSAATKNVLTNTLASTTGLLITDATNVGSASFDGGLIYGLSGANKGQSRVITSVSSTTSNTVTVPFKYDIAVGDKFLTLPWCKNIPAVQTTTAFTQADATIATGTGIPANVLEIEIETPVNDVNPDVWVYFVLRDHNFNPLA